MIACHAKASPYVQRGVYEVPGTTDTGYRVFISFNARGERVALRTVAPGEPDDFAIRWLWSDLDKEDPVSDGDASGAWPARFALLRGGLAGGLAVASALLDAVGVLAV